MAKIRKRPTDIFRLWRWESEFSLETFDSLGNIEKKLAFAWISATWADLERAITHQHKYAICIRALCMNDEASWEITKELRPEGKLKVSDMEEMYFEERIELLNDVQKAHIVDAGWVIQTYSDPRQIENDKWWRVGMPAATKERQQLWRYYHNKVKGIAA